MIFELSGLPLSTNKSLMAVSGRLIHTTEARNYKKATELALQNQFEMHLKYNPLLNTEILLWENEPLFCHIRLYGNWITKAETIRKTDIANREKLLIDSLVKTFNNNGYDIDDSAIYLLLMTKHESENEEKTVIEIGKADSYIKGIDING